MKHKSTIPAIGSALLWVAFFYDVFQPTVGNTVGSRVGLFILFALATTLLFLACFMAWLEVEK